MTIKVNNNDPTTYELSNVTVNSGSYYYFYNTGVLPPLIEKLGTQANREPNNNFCSFNGDDSIALVNSNGVVIDLIGNLTEKGPWPIGGVDNQTINKSLFRSKNIISGNGNAWTKSVDDNSPTSQGSSPAPLTGESNDDSAYKELLTWTDFTTGNSDPLLLNDPRNSTYVLDDSNEILKWSALGGAATRVIIPAIQPYASSLYENYLVARLDCVILGKEMEKFYINNSYKVIGNPFAAGATSTAYTTDNIQGLDLGGNANHLPVYIDLSTDALGPFRPTFG